MTPRRRSANPLVTISSKVEQGPWPERRRPLVPSATYSRPEARIRFEDGLWHGTTPKPLAFIDMRVSEPGFGLEDRRVLNVLMALSWSWLADPEEPVDLEVPASTLRAMVGFGAHSDNRRLRIHLGRLATTPVSLANGPAMPILDMAELPQGSDRVRWRFGAAAADACAAPRLWARLEPGICAGFTSRFAQALYEVAIFRSGLDRPQWTVDVNALRRIMGAEGGLSRWADFERKAILRAQSELATVAGIKVDYQPLRVHHGQRFDAVRFVFSSLGRPAGQRKASGKDPVARSEPPGQRRAA